MSLPLFYHQIVILLFIGLMSWAALSDALHYVIPNSVTLSLLVLYLAHFMASPTTVDWLGGVILAVILFALGIFIFARGIVGGGDVKLLSATALWVGTTHFPEFLIVMGFSGGVLALIVLALRHARRLRLKIASGGVECLETGETASHAGETTAAASSIQLVPYGVAIAAGGAYVGIQLLIGT